MTEHLVTLYIKFLTLKLPASLIPVLKVIFMASTGRLTTGHDPDPNINF